MKKISSKAYVILVFPSGALSELKDKGLKKRMDEVDWWLARFNITD